MIVIRWKAFGMARQFEFQVFADRQQFFLLDDERQPNYPESIDEDDLRRRFKRADHILAVYTEHASSMLVRVVLLAEQPDALLASCDHAIRTWIDVPSGRLIVAGCADYLPDCPRVAVPAGRNAVFVQGRRLGTNGETYEITLWPSIEASSSVLKQFNKTIGRVT